MQLAVVQSVSVRQLRQVDLQVVAKAMSLEVVDGMVRCKARGGDESDARLLTTRCVSIQYVGICFYAVRDCSIDIVVTTLTSDINEAQCSRM